MKQKVGGWTVLVALAGMRAKAGQLISRRREVNHYLWAGTFFNACVVAAVVVVVVVVVARCDAE